MVNENSKKVILAFNKQYPDLTVTSIVDYDAKGLYVIAAVPSDQTSKASEWLDALHSMDKKTMKVIGGFNPGLKDPIKYSEAVNKNTIYRRNQNGKKRPFTALGEGHPLV